MQSRRGEVHSINHEDKTMSKKAPMTPAAAARIQSAGAKSGNGQNSKGSFAARAQAAAAKNAGKGK